MKRLRKNPSFTFERCTAIKCGRIPNDGGGFLSHSCAFHILRGVRHI